MAVERRSVLKGIAATGFAGVAFNSSVLPLARAVPRGQVQPAQPILALISGAVAQSAFLQGIAAAPHGGILEVQQTHLSVDFVQTLNQRLRSGHSIRVIGLVDDASAAFIVQQARSAGARVLWLGQHATGAGNARHRVLSAASPDGGATVRDELTVQAQVVGASQWPAALGFALAAWGCKEDAAVPPINPDSATLSGSFVSLLIET